ncbi:MAG: TetR/AcrR family transcriptional regulator [Gemmatimonadales bacterium]|nr:TetR/AcrR family transcriptional regulator [Gemmatimonadales bacterium]
MSSGSAQVSKDEILNSAEELFARQGFDATTIKQIGDRASQNPALLYYYFGSKEGLYQAVLRRTIEGLVSMGTRALSAGQSPDQLIRVFVAGQMEFLLANPTTHKLIIRELIDHEARHAQELLLEVAGSVFARLAGAIEAGQRSGTFRTDVDPRFAAISTISQVVYFTLARPAIGLFAGFGPGGATPDLARAFARHAGDFAVRALSSQEQPS